MILPRSTYYDTPAEPVGDAELLRRMQTICDEFEAYGYRRVGAALRHQGIIVNAKKIRRLMREHDLQPKRRRRYVTTTDSDHDNPIFPDRARGMIVDGANQLWVADLTPASCIWPRSWMPGRDALLAMQSAVRSTRGSPLPRSRPPSTSASRRRVACTTRIVGRNTLPSPTADCSPQMASSDRWVDAATRMTTRKLKAS